MEIDFKFSNGEKEKLKLDSDLVTAMAASLGYNMVIAQANPNKERYIYDQVVKKWTLNLRSVLEKKAIHERKSDINNDVDSKLDGLVS